MEALDGFVHVVLTFATIGVIMGGTLGLIYGMLWFFKKLDELD